VQNVYDGSVVCNMYITEHGPKVNDGWHVEHHLFVEGKVCKKVQIC
jgi:hypothetical protein